MEQKKNRSPKTFWKILLLIGIPVAMFLAMSSMLNSNSTNKDDKVYSDYLQYFKEDKVEFYKIDLGTGQMEILLKEEHREDINKDKKIDDKDVISSRITLNWTFVSMSRRSRIILGLSAGCRSSCWL